MRLRTLGGLELETPSEAGQLRRPKPLLLLAYLAIEGAKERHHLAELFWPEARHPLESLRVALSQIRAAAPGALSEVDSPGAGARVGTTLSCDARELLAALAGPGGAAAGELYAGEFLAGFYLKEMGPELEEWVLATREHLANAVQAAYLTRAETLAAGLAFTEAGRLAATAFDLVTDTDPDLFARLYRLLAAAAHPYAAVVKRRAAAYGIALDSSSEEARATFAAATKTPILNNLPSRVAPFVGRDTELVTLTNLLGSGSRLVTVTGVGGVGKSRLALATANAALRDGIFADGVFHVDLAPLSDERLVLGSIAAVLGVDGGAEPTELARSIGRKSILLVLDNFEHLVDAGPQLSNLLSACGGLSAIVTSRRPLQLSGEQLFELRDLDLPRAGTAPADALAFDAVSLFQSVARRSQLSFAVDDETLAQVLEICRLVHGLPLGIELAASWVGRLSLAELVRTLSQGQDDSLSGPRDAASRHRSLRATIEHSWRLLDELERRAIAALATFSGGFTWEAASRVADVSLGTLRSLTARHLLTAKDGGRYDAHPLIAEFARERLRDSEATYAAVRRAHAAYFVDLAREAEQGLKGDGQAGWLDRLDSELPNLRAAMACLAADARSGADAAAPAALNLSGNLWQFWLQRGRLAEGRRLADEALNLAPAAGAPLERAKALTGAGVLANGQGDGAASEVYHRQALELRRAAGDRRGEARSLYNLAGLAGAAGDLEVAQEYLTTAIATFEDLGDEWSVAFALFNLATLARRRGRVDEAIASLEERQGLQRRLGDEAGIAETYGWLGIIKLDAGDIKGAEECLSSALEIARRLKIYPEEANALEGLALVALEHGSPAVSRRLFDESLALRAEYGLKPGPAYRQLADRHGHRLPGDPAPR